MIRYKVARLLVFCFLLSVLSPNYMLAQTRSSGDDVLFFKRKELNNGVLFYVNSEREQLLTDQTKYYEKLTLGSGAYQFVNSYWNFLDYKQDFLEFSFDVGPFYGAGNWTDSSFVEDIEADHSQLGFKVNGSAHYASRYYYNKKNYTIVDVQGAVRYSGYQQKSEGSWKDSTNTSYPYDVTASKGEFRFGFEAKAGWGWGRLNPMNNYMLSQYILEKYYFGRNFSDEEIKAVAREIYKIKGQRDIINGHKTDIESQMIADYLNKQLLLTPPEDLEEEWKMAEFLPRLNGNRIEIGPFFRYYNQEPDFIYGGYFLYENSKYCGMEWNRNFSSALKYNRYKKQDWINAEINISWSFYPDIKRQVDFGVKYVPGVELNNFEKPGEFNHGVIPFLGYYSQINSRARVNMGFAYRISADEKLMLPGPEFSLSFYSSRY